MRRRRRRTRRRSGSGLRCFVKDASPRWKMSGPQRSFNSSTCEVSRGGPGDCTVYTTSRGGSFTHLPVARGSFTHSWAGRGAQRWRGQIARAQQPPSPGERMCGVCKLVSASAPAAAARRLKLHRRKQLE